AILASQQIPTLEVAWIQLDDFSARGQTILDAIQSEIQWTKRSMNWRGVRVELPSLLKSADRFKQPVRPLVQHADTEELYGLAVVEFVLGFRLKRHMDLRPILRHEILSAKTWTGE